MTESTPTLVGWREWLSLPDWGIKRVRAKIDTGARTSALHVENLEVLPDGRLSFDVVLDRKENSRKVRVVTEQARTSTVRPSSGTRQRRPVVVTRMKLGSIEKPIEVSLVDRGPMLCRMLVGRRALGTDFVVSAEHRYLVSTKRKRRSKRNV